MALCFAVIAPDEPLITERLKALPADVSLISRYCDGTVEWSVTTGIDHLKAVVDTISNMTVCRFKGLRQAAEAYDNAH